MDDIDRELKAVQLQRERLALEREQAINDVLGRARSAKAATIAAPQAAAKLVGTMAAGTVSFLARLLEVSVKYLFIGVIVVAVVLAVLDKLK